VAHTAAFSQAIPGPRATTFAIRAQASSQESAPMLSYTARDRKPMIPGIG
jgi:hypothetical protein